MRAEQKKQAEEFTGLMETAHSEIRKALERRDTVTAQTLLGDCQNGAVALGNMIEKADGESCVTVLMLEEYGDLAYQIYEQISNGQNTSANKIYKTLRKALNRIVLSVKNDIKTSLEAVFLPYKASMWDSLESIWQAADQDPDCDAYVIPIPYYDRNPDGSFGKLHDERELYPDYVPVVKYEDYDFEKRRPDMIFIHNPYDECNYVTSVHPFFYSKNLKQHTENLIYVPYFILNDINPDNPCEVKGIEHFCVTPGVINADKVIVQSEDMRRAYINVLSEKSGNTAEQRKYWERKILGLGSPKVDKVLDTRKEDVEIPEEWLKIIEKADGSRKKIIFYNTSVGALLQHGEKMIDKMRRVFRTFRENSEDVTLLWRPHPLIPATIKSMRPQLWTEYQSVVREYRKEGWGIYDDSADLDRAIAVSNGYYGDPSSVVNLCRSIGMPVMIQNVEIYSEYNNAAEKN